ncbi:hypothetical protein MD535_01310 [Vibrio sp. ZSDZ65]|uniref:Uncharacterized protein n=1 Tax=Vibrio qingdaonensis TaxID=2829491 RepID=A0A9X3CK48_9VIBR|nr:hypothetical protein [Vibrio qingdaonensis]MCW8344664.1 hypothetical protein [Vibrio qingdaonensis]
MELYRCKAPNCYNTFKAEQPTSFCSSTCFSPWKTYDPKTLRADNRVHKEGRTKQKTRKGADAKTNGSNRRRYRIGDTVKCANPECSETFRVNAENHRYHSYQCRQKHQRQLKKEA